MEIVFAVIVFVVLFLLWVILPTLVRKRHNREKPENPNK